MPPEAIEILERALALPVEARVEIITRLLETLEGDDADVEAAWNAEIARRVAQLDAGEVTTIPWSEARELIRGR